MCVDYLRRDEPEPFRSAPQSSEDDDEEREPEGADERSHLYRASTVSFGAIAAAVTPLHAESIWPLTLREALADGGYLCAMESSP